MTDVKKMQEELDILIAKMKQAKEDNTVDTSDFPVFSRTVKYRKSQAIRSWQMNPRYTAFVGAHGAQPNYAFVDFIQVMLSLFAESKGRTHTPLNPFHLDDDGHDEFTDFIENNANKYKAAQQTRRAVGE